MKSVRWTEESICPSKIVCVGRNYVEHIRELNNELPGELVLFLKPNSAIASELRVPSQRCRYEAEICFGIEKGKVTTVAVGLDLTLVEVQQRLKKKGLPWEKSKAFDGSAVFSDFVDLPDGWDGLEVTLSINGEPKQRGGVGLMMVPPQEILRQVSEIFTLIDGDVIMTGTPKGVGEFVVGDVFEAAILQHGKMLVQARWVATAT